MGNYFKYMFNVVFISILKDRDRKKPIKAILYVSGDSLRVVDESNKVIFKEYFLKFWHRKSMNSSIGYQFLYSFFVDELL